MGFSLPSVVMDLAKFDGGYLFIKTDLPFYYAGQTVTGKVYIHAERVFKPKKLVLRIKGKEKFSHMYNHRETEEDSYADEEGHTRMRDKTKTFRKKMKKEMRIMDFKETMCSFKEPMREGNYVVPFEFGLPDAMSSSVMWKQIGRAHV